MKKLFFAFLIAGLTTPQLSAADKQPPRHSLRLAGERPEGPFCMICQDTIVLLEHSATLPCNHAFHDTCITPWTIATNTCPTCRHLVDKTGNIPESYSDAADEVWINRSRDAAAIFILLERDNKHDTNNAFRIAKYLNNEALMQLAVASGANSATPVAGNPINIEIERTDGSIAIYSWRYHENGSSDDKAPE